MRVALRLVRMATLLLLSASVSVPALGAAPTSATARPEPPGLGDPGSLQALQIDSLRNDSGACQLAGRDATAQLLVTGQFSSSQTRDLSRDVQYSAQPEGIVKVDS